MSTTGKFVFISLKANYFIMKIFVFVALIAVAFAATKEDLNADAARLKKLAQDEISKLEKEGKTVMAKEIKVIEDAIINVEKHLETLHPNTEIGKVGIHALETILKGLEHKLEAELKKLGGSFYDNTKDDLIKDANRLRGLAQNEIKKLKAQGKHVVAAELEVLDKKLHSVEQQLEKLHPTTEAGKVALNALETVVRSVEHKLEAKLKSLGGAFYDSTKDQLTADAAKLKKMAEAEIKKLEGEGKKALADGIRVLEKDIITVEKHLESVQPNTEAGKVALHAVETVLKGLESKLEAKIKSLGGSFYDTKEDLIKDASRLRNLAQEEIKKLKAEGKHLLAAEIEVLDKSLHTVEQQLEKLHPTSEAGKVALHALEAVVKGLETKLEAKIKSLGGSFYDTKEDLIKDASRLRNLAQEEIKKLKAEGKHLLAAEIEVLDKSLHTVEQQLEKLHPTSEAGKVALHALEAVVKGLETKLEAKIKSLGGSFYDTKEDLIKDASRLRNLAQEAIKKLKGEGKHLLAAEIQVLDTKLHAVEQQLEKLHPTTEVGKVALQALEAVVKGLETKLETKIKSLGN